LVPALDAVKGLISATGPVRRRRWRRPAGEGCRRDGRSGARV